MSLGDNCSGLKANVAVALFRVETEDDHDTAGLKPLMTEKLIVRCARTCRGLQIPRLSELRLGSHTSSRKTAYPPPPVNRNTSAPSMENRLRASLIGRLAHFSKLVLVKHYVLFSNFRRWQSGKHYAL